jgi:hypothetical protein
VAIAPRRAVLHEPCNRGAFSTCRVRLARLAPEIDAMALIVAACSSVGNLVAGFAEAAPATPQRGLTSRPIARTPGGVLLAFTESAAIGRSIAGKLMAKLGGETSPTSWRHALGRGIGEYVQRLRTYDFPKVGVTIVGPLSECPVHVGDGQAVEVHPWSYDQYHRLSPLSEHCAVHLMWPSGEFPRLRVVSDTVSHLLMAKRASQVPALGGGPIDIEFTGHSGAMPTLAEVMAKVRSDFAKNSGIA